MNAFRAVVVSLFAAFLAMIVWASVEKDIFEGLGPIMDERWGLATLGDLYLGFAFTSAWIALVEERKRLVPVWIVSLLFLGNLVTMVYLLKRTLRAGSVREVFLPAAPAAQPTNP